MKTYYFELERMSFTAQYIKAETIEEAEDLLWDMINNCEVNIDDGDWSIQTSVEHKEVKP